MPTHLAQVPGPVGGGGAVGGTTALEVWGGAITNSLQSLWIDFAAFIPNLIVAVILFFVLWWVGILVGRLVEKVLVVLRINQAFENIKGLKDVAARAGLKINIPLVVGEIVKWFVIAAALLTAADILGLQEVSAFLRSVLAYIPNVVVAALILVISVILANFVYRTVLASVNAAGFSSGAAVAAISKWAIIIFAFMAALLQLDVAASLIQTILTALFAMIAIAGGLAFGLGGKEMAAKWLQKLEHDFTERK